MNDIKFKSLEELYKRLIPAFNVKINDLRRNNIKNIHSEDLWNYLRKNSWNNSTNLSLGEMVNDILNLSDKEIVNYVLSKEK